MKSLAAGLLVTTFLCSSQPVGQAANSSLANGFRITQRQKDTTIITFLSAEGAAWTQYAADGTALRGAILRYRDARTFGLDYSDHTAHSVTLETAVANRLAETARLAHITAVPNSGTVRGTLNPPPVLSRTALSATIGGLRAEAIAASVGGRSVRIWLSAQLPQMPRAFENLLARLVVDCTATSTDQDAERRSACGAEGVSLARTLARTFALRTEVRINGRWMTAIDTTDIRRVHVPSSTFDPPSRLRVVPVVATTATGTGPTGPGFNRQGGGPTPLSATVRVGPGPLLAHVDIYQFYWGRMFSRPENKLAVAQLTAADNSFFHGYTDALSQYGIGPPGGLQNAYFINDDPERAVGTKLLDWVLVGAHVAQWSFQTSAPSFWWVYGGHDPLYMIYVPMELVADDGWSGFHLATPALANLLLGAFLAPFVHPFLPYGLAKIPQNAMTLPAWGTLFRATCEARPTFAPSPGPPDCPSILGALPSFDAGTENLSHELVEAITDPYPFFGWWDAGKGNVWDSEIADICYNKPFPFGAHTIVGVPYVTGQEMMFAVSTYWSNLDNACVPESRPSITLTSPVNGETIAWLGPHGPRLGMLASATDPLDGNLNTISWALDGTALAQTGPNVFVWTLPLGTHSVTASVTDSQHLSVSASASFTVVASPPTGTIISPAAGASVVAGSFALHGDATDPQDSLPESAFTWAINGTTLGQKQRIVVASAPLGPINITLTVTNSAGLQWTGTRSVVGVASTGAPSVAIISPVNPSGFPVPNTNIPPTEHFSAIATDADGSVIPDAGFKWTDSIDGVLHTGAASFDRALSGNSSEVTVHVVTCTVTGASGTATDTTTVYVGQIP